MLLDPALIALLTASAASAATALPASAVGVGIALRWDRGSGSPLQIRLERRTSLVSLLVSFALGVEAVSLFFLVAAAERLHPLFTGAMCAVGTFNAAPWGYPALAIKAAAALLGSLWLLLNHLDAQGHDYPLLRLKYALLPPLALLLAADTAALLLFFNGLDPDVITSCCGTIFDQARPDSGFPIPPPLPSALAFFAAAGAVMASAAGVVRRGNGALLLALSSTLFLAASAFAFPSLICPALYRLPTHHCPFCVLQAEYGYVGHLLYLPLFAATVAGWGTGMAHLFRRRESLAEAVPRLRRALALTALACTAFLALLASLALLLAWG